MAYWLFRGTIALALASFSAPALGAPVSVTADLGTGTGFAEESDFRTSFGALGSYSFYRSYFLSLWAGYSHTHTEYEDVVPNNQFEDVVLTLGDAKAFELKKYRLSGNYSLQAILPTSNTSQRSSLRAGYSLGGALQKQLGRVSSSLGSRFYLYDHQYQTINAAGTAYNNRIAFENALDFSLPLKKLNLFTGATLFTAQNYADNFYTSYSLRGGAGYSILKNLSATLTLSSADRIVTDNSLFERENSSIFLNLTYLLMKGATHD